MVGLGLDVQVILQCLDRYILPPNQDHAYQADLHDPWRKRYVNCTGELIHRLAIFHGIEHLFYFPQLDISTELKLIHNYLKMNFHDANPLCAPVIHRIIQRLGQPKANQRPPDFIFNAREFIQKKLWAFSALFSMRALSFEVNGGSIWKGDGDRCKLFSLIFHKGVVRWVG